MNVSLTKKLEKWVRDQVKGGSFETASEVVRDALRLAILREEKLVELRALVEEGYASAERNGWIEVNEAYKKKFKAQMRKGRSAAQRRSKAS